MEIIFLRGAETDLQQIYEHLGYEQGETFFLVLDHALKDLRQFPQIGRSYLRRYRRYLLPKYPHAIIYVAESNRIVIHSIFDLRQDPQKLMDRLP
jgi:plasmid stabilization system protein ParE